MLCCWTLASSASALPPAFCGPWLCWDCRPGVFRIRDRPGALPRSILPKRESVTSGVSGPPRSTRVPRLLAASVTRRPNGSGSPRPEPGLSLLRTHHQLATGTIFLLKMETRPQNLSPYNQRPPLILCASRTCRAVGTQPT